MTYELLNELHSPDEISAESVTYANIMAKGFFQHKNYLLTRQIFYCMQREPALFNANY